MMLLAIAALASSVSGQGRADPPCAVRADYLRVQREIARADPATAVRALYRYAADPAHEDPAGCTDATVERATGEQERKLVALVSDGKPLHPWLAAHCFHFDPRTTSCQDVVQDGTGQPDYVHILPQRRDAPFVGRLKSLLPEARLVGFYRTTLRAAQDGRSVTALGTSSEVQIAHGGAVLIAVFTAPGPHWRYRKFVWYL